MANRKLIVAVYQRFQSLAPVIAPQVSLSNRRQRALKTLKTKGPKRRGTSPKTPLDLPKVLPETARPMPPAPLSPAQLRAAHYARCADEVRSSLC